jgi:hypothetical protein
MMMWYSDISVAFSVLIILIPSLYHCSSLSLLLALSLMFARARALSLHAFSIIHTTHACVYIFMNARGNMRIGCSLTAADTQKRVSAVPNLLLTCT